MTNAKQILVSYLHGLGDGGIDIGHDHFELPLFLRAAVVSIMTAASHEDGFSATTSAADLFERGGKWHRAANVAMFALDTESRRMTANYDAPRGIRWGDRLHEALMSAMRGAV